MLEQYLVKGDFLGGQPQRDQVRPTVTPASVSDQKEAYLRTIIWVWKKG